MSLFRARPVLVQPETRSLSFPWRTDSVASSAGEHVDRPSALALPPVWRAVTLVSELLSSMPVDLYRGSGPTRVEVKTLPPVVASPSLRVTRREWVAQYVLSMMLDGNAYGVVMSWTPLGLPETVEWVDPRSVTVECTSSLAPPTYRLDGIEIPANRIVHVRNVVLPGCIEGLSPIEVHAETLGLSIAARKFGAKWFGDGAHPSAILSTEMRLTKPQADEMKKSFVASLRGRREPAVLGSDIKYTPIQISPEQSQFLGTINANVNDIAQIFGVPVEMIGGSPSGSGLTYANREQRWQDFIATCLNHYAVRLEDAWSAMTVRGQSVKFNLDALLRGDTLTRMQVHDIAIRNKIETVNEARELEDRPPIDGGDDFPAPPAPPAPAGSTDEAQEG